MWLLLVFDVILAAMVVKFALDIVLAVWCNAVYGVPYVPTKTKLVRQAVRLLDLTRGQRVVELGSGDGRVLSEFGRQFWVSGVGYEKNGLLLWLANLRWQLTWPRRGKIRFVKGDLFEVSLKGVDVVYMYLLPWMIERLKTKLEKDLKKGAIVISFDYPLMSKKFTMEKLVGRGKQKIAIYRKAS